MPEEGFWTFGHAYTSNTCNGATDGMSGPGGTIQGRYSRYNTLAMNHGVASTGPCNVELHLLCIARR